ncbi:MAG: ABC transporter ATP-binding protein [Tissierella sp.]|nr:ABC transporter ATP-binding protein [Tissierella sp.]
MFKTIRFLFKKIREYDFLMIPIMIVFTILSSIYPFIWVIVPAKVISLTVEGDSSLMIQYVILGGLLSILCAMGTSFLRGNYRMRMNNVRYHLIRDLIEYSLTMPYENTLDPKQLTKIALADISVKGPMQGAGGIILMILSLFGNLFASIGFLSLMSTLSFWIMLVLFILVLGSFYFSSKAASFDESTWNQWGEYERRYFQTTNIMTDPSYGKDIRLYSLIEILESYCNKLINQFKIIAKSVSKKNIQMDTAVAVLNILRDVVVFSYIARLLLVNQIDASEFFLYTTGTTSLVVILQESMKQISDIRKESNRFFHFISLMEEENQVLKDSVEIKDIKKTIGGDSVTVDIVDVSFRYPNSENDVLNHLNLTIRPGEKMALVGENGSGKSTLIKLLCKLYKPSSGTIYLNGIDINQIPDDIYWEIIGAVFQDAMVFPFSIRDNITLEESADEERLSKAINDSRIEQIMDGLSNGMETILLRILDDEGLDISGGQRQKLYLARALYKNNRFLMLDEPTAALDPLAEASLYEQYDSLSKEKTSLYISHRLASTKFCDRVAYLKDGRIVELGTHDELMDLNGEYKELFHIQAKYYRESDQGKEEVLYEN